MALNAKAHVVDPQISYKVTPNTYGVAVYWVRGLIPSPKEQGYSLLSIYKENGDGSRPKGWQLPAYYIHLGKPPVLPLWPFDSHKLLAIFRGNLGEHSILKHYILKNDPRPLRSALLSYSPLGAHLCGVGRVRPRDDYHNAVEDKRIDITEGLGHGQWRDYALTELLRNDDPRFGDGIATWFAQANGWVLGTEDKIVWRGMGEPIRGSLMLVFNSNDPQGECRPLALYKPRCADWLLDGEDKSERNYDKRHGVGRLCMLLEDSAEAVIQHVLLTVISIEEQIRMSRGFCGKYRSGWGEV